MGPDEKRLRTMARLAGRGRILDVGFMNWPNRHLRGDVIGVDLHARDTIPPYGHLVRGDAHAFPFADEQFTAVVAGELIEHLIQPLTFLCECNRILRTGGRLVLSTPNPHTPVEAIKNLLFFQPDPEANTHIAAFPFQLMTKLALINGFRLFHITGDYIRIPKLGLKIGSSWFPSFCVHQIFAFEKTRRVSPGDLERTLQRIRDQERQRSSGRKGPAGGE